MKILLFFLVLFCLSKIKNLQENFDKIDVNKDGKIDFDELYNSFKDTKENIQNLIEIFDLDGDELLDLEEYKELFLSSS